MRSFLHLIVFFPLLLAFSFPPAIAHDKKTGDDLIHDACKKTSFVDLCISSLKSDETSVQADLKKAVSITLKLAHANATATAQHISKLQKSTKDDFSVQCLNDCSEMYEDAIEHLEDSMHALETDEFNDVSTWVTGAMASIDSCEGGFKDEPGHESPLSVHNGDFFKLCSNTLSIMRLLPRN